MMKKFGWLIFLLWPMGSRAALTGFLDDPSLKNCIDSGNCQISDVATAALLLIKLLLGGMGAVALIFFIYGGIEWLTSEGVPNRISRGKEIMVNTIWALIIAFSSYLILSFFINNILNVKSELRIAQEVPECRGKADNTACGSGDVYLCYQENCISKCALKAKMSSENWQCYEVANPSLVPDSSEYFEKNLCPGDESIICTLLNDNGDPALLDDPVYQAANPAIVSCFINHVCP